MVLGCYQMVMDGEKAPPNEMGRTCVAVVAGWLQVFLNVRELWEPQKEGVVDHSKKKEGK